MSKGGSGKGPAGVPGLSRRTKRAEASRVVDAYETAHGGRDGVVDVLRSAADPRAERLVALLSDPLLRGKTVLELCYDADIAPSSLLLLLRDGAVSRAIAQAHVSLAARLPAVMDQIADAAEGGLVACRCTIGGQKAALPTCNTCRGTGLVPRDGSLPHQELVLETLNMRGGSARGGVNVNVQQTVAVAHLGVFDAFIKAAGGAKTAPLRRPEDRPVLSAAVRDEEA